MHLILRNPHIPSPSPADAQRVHDILWASLDDDSMVEHIRSRTCQNGIDLGVFLRGDIESAERMFLVINTYIGPLMSQLPGWIIVPPEAPEDDQ